MTPAKLRADLLSLRKVIAERDLDAAKAESEALNEALGLIADKPISQSEREDRLYSAIFRHHMARICNEIAAGDFESAERDVEAVILDFMKSPLYPPDPNLMKELPSY